jgi:hypothetical protein
MADHEYNLQMNDRYFNHNLTKKSSYVERLDDIFVRTPDIAKEYYRARGEYLKKLAAEEGGDQTPPPATPSAPTKIPTPRTPAPDAVTPTVEEQRDNAKNVIGTVRKSKAWVNPETKQPEFNDKMIADDFEKKVWQYEGKTDKDGVQTTFKREPLPVDIFKTLSEYKTFLNEHEKAHLENPPKKGESQGDYAYESRISRIALENMGKTIK